MTHQNIQPVDPIPTTALVRGPEVPLLISQIRPSWKAKNLIARVEQLIPVDPSSACQRIFNAAIHDLREKITIAGIDIAKEAAEIHKLPPLTQAEDVEDYSTFNIIQIAYRIGLLTRPEWRRLSRCYEIRRDLEHEDNEYEAGPEDCIYIFKTCVEVVLSKDPIQPLKIEDVKDLITQPSAVHPSESLLTDYESAPQTRQEKICKFLISIALDKGKSEITQQNAYNFLTRFEPLTQNAVKLGLVDVFQNIIGRSPLDLRCARVAFAAGVFPYLKSAHRQDFFEHIYSLMKDAGTHWKAYEKHGDLLRNLKEVGGLIFCPESPRKKILSWLVATYIGEPGGPTRYGNIRHVFYSDTAAPLIEEIVKDARAVVVQEIHEIAKSKSIGACCTNLHIARRLETLLDFVER